MGLDLQVHYVLFLMKSKFFLGSNTPAISGMVYISCNQIQIIVFNFLNLDI